MMNDNRKYAIYSRKSKYTGKGESVGNQIELCKNYLKTKYDANPDDILVYEDEGYTGANTKRPEFQKMLKDIKAKRIKTVICYRLDRISRNVLDFCNLKDQLSDYNVSFISIREDFDTSTPMGSAMLLITSVFAQLERDTIAERIRDNMLELAKTGRWLGGHTPFGFQSDEIEKVSIDGKKRKLFKLKPIETEEQVYHLICNKFIELNSLTQLETYLIQNDIKTRNNIYFSRMALRSILTNPVYATADEDSLKYFKDKNADIFNEERFDGKHGLMVYNKTIQKTGKAKKVRDIEDWIVAVGKHHGFLTGRQWVEIQTLLDNNSEKRYRKPAINTALLSGILYCANCGSYMRPKLNYATYEDGTRSFSYMCELKEKSRCQKCNSKNILGIELDNKIYEVIEQITSPNGELYQKIKKMSNGEFQDEETDTKNEIETLQKTKAQNEKAISSLVQKLALVSDDLVGSITDEIHRIKEANKKIEEQLSVLIGASEKSEKEINYAKLVLYIFDNYFQSFHKFDLVTKRSLIRLIIQSIEYKGDDIIIHLVGADPNKPEIKWVSLSGVHSKRNPNAFSQPTKIRSGCLHERPD